MELQNMRGINIDETPEWIPLFDPAMFQRDHPAITIDDWRLTDDQLQQYALDIMEIRRRIKEKADLI